MSESTASKESNGRIFASVVIPVFNEEQSLKELIDRIDAVFSSMGKSYEIIFVDDGSTDGSRDALELLSEQNIKVRYLLFRMNQGKSISLMAGVLASRGDIIVMIDGDLQDHPEDIPDLLTKLESGYDMVVGWRKERKDTSSRKLGSRFFNWGVSFSFKIYLHDYNCGLKAIRREVSQSLKIYGQFHRFLPVLAHVQGYKVAEVQVKNSERKFGLSRYPTFRFEAFFDLMTILFLTKYQYSPLHFFSHISLFFIVPCGLMLLYFIFSQFLYWFGLSDPLWTRPLLVLSTTGLLIGLNIFFTGFICEFMLHHSININMADKLDRLILKKK